MTRNEAGESDWEDAFGNVVSDENPSRKAGGVECEIL